MMNRLPPLRLVLVEDSPELCESWQDILSLEGHEVVTCLRAQELLDPVRHVP